MSVKENTDVIEDQALFQQISRPIVVNADQTPQFSDIRKAGHDGDAFLFVPKRTRAPAPHPVSPCRCRTS
jgi:hypothetical protein